MTEYADPTHTIGNRRSLWKRRNEDAPETCGVQAHEEERNQGEGVHQESQVAFGDVMTPPLHITGATPVDWIISTIGAVFCLYWLRALRLARAGARLILRNLGRAVLLFCVLMTIMGFMSLHSHPSTHVQFIGASILAGFVSFIFFAAQSTERSRTIPKATRRAVIERDLKGEKFDPERHHIDHVWPFSKGGSHTTDNLRVVEKKTNLQKGAKRPRLRDMW